LFLFIKISLKLSWQQLAAKNGLCKQKTGPKHYRMLAVRKNIRKADPVRKTSQDATSRWIHHLQSLKT
jgi:hypothetical protein